MDYRVEIINNKSASVLIGKDHYTVSPIRHQPQTSIIAKITDWSQPLIHEYYIDKQGRSIHTKHNFKWLIDLTMEHGLRFPSMED